MSDEYGKERPDGRQVPPRQEMSGVRRVDSGQSDSQTVKPSASRKRSFGKRGTKQPVKDDLDNYEPGGGADEQPIRRTRAVGSADADSAQDFSDWDSDSGSQDDPDAKRSDVAREAGEKDSKAFADRKAGAARAKGKRERAGADAVDKASDAAIKSGDPEAAAVGVVGKTAAGAAKGASKAREDSKVRQAKNEQAMEDEAARSASTDDVAGSVMRQEDLRDKQDKLKRDEAKAATEGAAKGAAEGFKSGMKEFASSGQGGEGMPDQPGQDMQAGADAQPGPSVGQPDAKKDDGPVDADAWDRENEKADSDRNKPDSDKDKDKDGDEDDKDKDKDGDDKDDKDGGKKNSLMDKLTGGNKKGLAKVKDIAKKALHLAKLGFEVAKNLFLMGLMNYLAGLVSSVVTAATNIFTAAVQAVIGFISNVANALAMPFAAAAALIAIIASVATGGTVATVAGYVNATAAVRDDPIREDCVVVGTLGVDSDGLTGDTAAMMRANGKIIWSVYGPNGYGGSNEAVSGILGNWQVESGVDPTGVETVYSEPYMMGVTKSTYWKNFNFNLPSLAGVYPDLHDYHVRFPSIETLGIGLGQWTNSRAEKLLAYAEAAGREWYDITLQLAYSLDSNGDGAYHTMLTHLGNTYSTPGEAADWFRIKWEVIGDGSSELRQENATAWMGEISTWASEGADSAYYDSVFELVGNVAISGDGTGVSSSSSRCMTAAIADNEKLAYAGGLIAYMSQAVADQKFYPDGESGGAVNTPKTVYKSVKDALEPGGLYASCDRVVCTAVRWSGTDDSFPWGGCSTIIEYLERGEGRFNGSCGWVNVTDEYNESNWEELPVGTVMIVSDANNDSGHVVLYTGKLILNNIYGGQSGFNANSCVVAGSYYERQAGCELFSNGYVAGSLSDIFITTVGGVEKAQSKKYQLYVWSGPLNWGFPSTYTDAGGVGTVEYIFSNKDNFSVVGSDFYT